MKKTILHLCADIGSDSEPYKMNGYNVIKIGSDIGIENYEPPENVYGIIANPPCTEFSNAKLIKNTHHNTTILERCLIIINQCQGLKFYVIENPASSSIWDYLPSKEKTKFTYQPWEFGSPWTKMTRLYGYFNKPNKKYSIWEDVPKLDLPTYQGRPKPALAKLHKNHIKLIPEFKSFKVKTDSDFRSLCSQKFAQAFFEVNQ